MNELGFQKFSFLKHDGCFLQQMREEEEKMPISTNSLMLNMFQNL